ncbi:hypothetical protein EUGRSUZ_K01304 [Eucalyptus grandis]|uniref:Uncharacterized protein n=2 Tax=Eucalyptus grandis TaxID=71139 RepID=A0ACC3IUP4_EUCGR|nr:hypothetical protein EUGRSUZ_K01304 [Eucalyptus grandis]
MEKNPCSCDEESAAITPLNLSIFACTEETENKHTIQLTPFSNFLPLAGKMLTYLEAIRKPKKHMVNTFAIGSTAILIVPISDSPPTCGSATIARNLCIFSGLHRGDFPSAHPPVPPRNLRSNQFTTNDQSLIRPPILVEIQLEPSQMRTVESEFREVRDFLQAEDQILAVFTNFG